MGTVNVTYYADNLGEVADELIKRGNAIRASVRHAPTKKERRIGHAEARGLDLAASIVRKVVLNPPLVLGDGAPMVEVTPHSIPIAGDAKYIEQGEIVVVDDRLPTKGDAFDFSRATNLYLMAAREYGTCLGGQSITALLVARTDWSYLKCKHLGDRVVNDQAIIDLMEFEGVPESYDNG